MSETIRIKNIRTDGGTQPRAQLDAFVVSDYTEAMERGDSFPPVRVVYDGEDYWLWDGFHRLKAAEKLGRETIEAEVSAGTHQDAVWKSLSANKDHGLRRTRADKKRAVIRALEGWGESESARAIARHVGVDHKTVLRYHEEVGKSTTSSQKDNSRGKGGRVQGADGKWYPAKQKPQRPKLPDSIVEAVKDTHVPDDLSEQRELAKVQAEDQHRVAGLVKNNGLTVREARRKLRRVHRQDQVARAESEPTPLEEIEKRYSVIYADPPWQYDFSRSDSRKIENHYSTLDASGIAALPVSDIAASECILFMWATAPKIKEALQVMEGWGFEYKTQFVWVKDKIGMGYYCRGQHELLFVGKRGNIAPPIPENRVSSVLHGKRTEHSRKPANVRRIIESMYPENSKIELFARDAPDGWDTWGAMA